MGLGKAGDHRGPHYSKWGPGTRTITGRLVGNEESQAAAHVYWIRLCIFTRSLGDSHLPQSWRSTGQGSLPARVPLGHLCLPPPTPFRAFFVQNIQQTLSPCLTLGIRKLIADREANRKLQPNVGNAKIRMLCVGWLWAAGRRPPNL